MRGLRGLRRPGVVAHPRLNGDVSERAFGRIAEQYGERDIAIADYRKLQKPKEPLELPTSSYRLAQARLGILGAGAGPASK